MKISALLTYWRNCLADGEHLSPDIGRGSSYNAKFQEIEDGHLSKTLTEKIFQDARKNRSRGGRTQHEGGPPKIHSVELLIAPFLLKLEVEHGERSYRQSLGARSHAPLWLAAKVDETGRLSGDETMAPFIGRQFLEPSGRVYFSIGELAAADEFRTVQAAPEEPQRWRSHLEYAERFLEAVTGQANLRAPSFDGAVATGPILLLKDERIKATRHLLELYDQLRSEVDPSALLNSVVTRQSTRGELLGDLASLLENGSSRHFGHVSAEFGLKPSQRRALLATLSLENSQLLAVNGPPGTGKTTLIQSIVSSLWVEKAIDGEDPPLIHACSTNNRAIVNILETFARSGSESSESGEELLARRWIQGLEGFGLLMPSGNAAKKYGERYPIAQPGYPEWTGMPAEVQTPEFHRKANESYTDAARRNLGPSAHDVGSAVGFLKKQLEEKKNFLWSIQEQGSCLFRIRARHGLNSSAAVGSFLDRRRAELEEVLERWQAISSEVEECLKSITLWEDLLAFIPAIAERRKDKALAPFRKREVDTRQPFSWSRFRPEIREFVEKHEEEQRSRLEELKVWRRREAKFRECLLEASQWLRSESEEARQADIQRAADGRDQLEEFLDRTLRRCLFHSAARYWEGRWLLEIEKKLNSSGDNFKRGQSPAACLERFRRWSKLTPITVSTFHLLPKLFHYFDGKKREQRPLDECFDLLIIDEAGQTTPEVGAPSLHYAKRAVVLGDVHQIEPIWSIDRVLDMANAERTGLRMPEGDAALGLRSSSDSLMLLAQRLSQWVDQGGVAPGLLLSEHWRCRPEIISYCNDLVYQGRLEPKRSSATGALLPALGWAHVDHPSSRRGGSRQNAGQAKAIAEWINSRRGELESEFGPLGESLGIVTPFKAQAQEIRSLLAANRLGTVEVGTVHTFQGGEKKVMIFSPVYSSGDSGPYFFDIGPNMLNVAVSRARESFLVFGDMSIFQPDSSTPSGQLARRLFADPSHEITDINAMPRLSGKARVERLDTLEKHRSCLREAFLQAVDRLVIVSPYLTLNAIRSDDIFELVTEATKRSVRVVVAFCRDLSKPKVTKESVETLRDSGAEVWALDRIHNKTLAVDSNWIVEGSFNWLSATRDRDSPFRRSEVSLRCGPPEAVEMIEEAWEKLEKKWQAAE